MTGEVQAAWPAPPTEARPWHTQALRLRDGGRRAQVVVREVRLWGRWVLINQADEVWCPDCLLFRSVDELGAPDNSCKVGVLRPDAVFRFESQPERPPTIMDMGF